MDAVAKMLAGSERDRKAAVALGSMSLTALCGKLKLMTAIGATDNPDDVLKGAIAFMAQAAIEVTTD